MRLRIKISVSMNTTLHSYGNLHYELKQKCRKFIDRYLQKELEESFLEYFRPSGEDFSNVDESQIMQYPDRFLLFGKTNQDKRVLSLIQEKVKLTEEETMVLEDWKEKAFAAFFKILAIEDHSLTLFDITGEVEYEVFSNTDGTFAEMMPDVKPGFFIYTNIVPVKEVWFLSGAQQALPPESEEKLHIEYVQKQGPKEMYRNNPKKLALGFDLNKKEYFRFKEYFGRDEVFVRGENLKSELMKYHEDCRLKIGSDLPVPEFDFPTHLTICEDVGMIMEEEEGQHFFTYFGAFCEVFKNCKLDPASKLLGR
jgi:hypothetical protein